MSLDSRSVFKLTQSAGVVTAVSRYASLSTGTVQDTDLYWKAAKLSSSDDVAHIRAYLKQGDLKLTAKSSKTFYLYRLYNGSDDLDDGRESEKLAGETDDYDASSDSGKYTTTVTDAGTEVYRFFNDGLGSPFVLKAQAASASTIEYPADSSNTWQLIASKSPGNGSSYTFQNLISGQRYLIREGTSTSKNSSDKYYMVKSVSSSGVKSLSSAASSASSSGSSGSSAATSRSNTGVSLVTTGSGTQNSGAAQAGAAGARGSATGDESNLWFHLIVMILAFDALVADLLYISRKKKRGMD